MNKKSIAEISAEKRAKEYFKIPMFRERLNIILKHYGPHLQIIKSIEELSELTKELTKEFMNLSIGKNMEVIPQPNPFILEEIADVYVMLGQLKLIFNIDENMIGKKIHEKLTRTLIKIESVSE